MSEQLNVYVGSDESQELAVKVLEHSIKRHTTLSVNVISMTPFPVKDPVDPRQRKRTGFSFSRFNIPKLNNYQGRAVYMDADMMVFKDIRELWEMPFDGSKLIIQDDLNEKHTKTDGKDGAPSKRIKQTAVMVLNCEKLDWDVDQIVKDLDDWKYSYEELMYHLCIMDEKDISYKLPFEWNSLEFYDQNTRLIHYTDMKTQPWVAPNNKFGYLWFKELQLMLKNGSITRKEITDEIDKGYFRPSLIKELDRKQPPRFPMWHFYAVMDQKFDDSKGYVKHKEVYEAKKLRKKAIKDFEMQLQQSKA